MSELIKSPTEAELEILHILWAAGPSSVRVVHEKLNEQREVVYTTTLKIMQNMHDKKLVTRDDSARTHIYAAAVQQEDTQKQLLNQFVQSAFKGSAMQLVMQALGNHNATADELAEIRALIDKVSGE